MKTDKWLALAQLVRLPNVFTAIADILMGLLICWSISSSGGFAYRNLLLILASSCLYLAGMVWNDVFDVEEDRRQRPFRPLPSGRVSMEAAKNLGCALMIAGVGFGILVGERSGWLAAGLALLILAYDGVCKGTWVGPLAMGACRSTNVLLGLSPIADSAFDLSARLHLASVIGLYVLGITWFARTEAQESRKSSLVAAFLCMLAAIMLALASPILVVDSQPSIAFVPLLAGLAIMVGQPAVSAFQDPKPQLVQSTVKRAIFGLIVFDAALACGIAGSEGLLLLCLLPLSISIGRWVYST